MTRGQLLELGFTVDAIRHRIAKGRLHPVHHGVFAVGRPELTRHGEWMAAVLACGPGAALSHDDAAALFEMRRDPRRPIEVSIPSRSPRRIHGITAHRRPSLTANDVTTHHGIPVTTPTTTLVDLATRLPRHEIEAAINEADKHDLIDPEALRRSLDDLSRRPGAGRLRKLLDRRTVVLTDSELERRFLPLADRAGLPPPTTQVFVNGYKVDFFWPDLGLVVETDGLRYHRTAQQQARDRIRDQAHTAAGMTPLRFTHDQIANEPAYVRATLSAVAARLNEPSRPS